jgi:integrase
MPNDNDYIIGRFDGGLAVSWWEDGKRRRYRLKARTRKEAEGEAADKVRTERAKSAGSTIAELWELYRKEKSGKRIAEAMKFEWRVIKPFFGHLRPEQVTVELCRVYTEARRAMISRHKRNVQDGTIWTELGHLRTVFIWAHERKLIAFAPPVERPSKPAPKGRWLTREEIDRLQAVKTAPHIALAIRLMLETAGRVGAILELTWDRVDFEARTINLRTTETGLRKGRAAVPMNDGLRAMLQTARAAALTDYVVEWAGNKEPLGSIKTGFNKAVKDAGLEAVTPHVLRHTAAVHLAAAGRPMSKISQYLGHSSTAVTERVYARFAPGHLREEAAVLDFSPRAKAV